MFSEKVKNALRDMYRELRIPVQLSIYEDACLDATFEDMFVDLRLDRPCATALPEILGYRDVEKLKKLMQSSERIPLSQLFDKLHDKDVPKTVLILGRPGVGKTTVIKQMARLWAEGKLWKDTVEYLFVVTLHNYNQERKLTLTDLLLDGLGLTESERNVAMQLLRTQRSKVTLVAEGWDELSYKDTGIRERDDNKLFGLNTILSSLTNNTMLPEARIVITSRPSHNLPPRNRTIEMYGFTDDSIQNYIEQFSRDDKELKVFIGDYLKNNVNIASMCFLPIHCNFVCACLSDMRLSTQNEDTPTAVITLTRLYVLAAINLANKLHPALKHIHMQNDSKLFFDTVGNSLICHSELAKHNTMSTTVRILCYEEDLDRFGVHEEDRGTGFLAECQVKGRVACFKRKCWTFNHLTLQEMFAAIGLLRGPQQALLELVEDKASIRQREVLIKFVIGLWCDSQNAWFMEHLRSVRGQLDLPTHPHPGKLIRSI